MTRNLKLLINFIWKFLGTIRFGNDHVAAILGFGDLQWGNILITRVYFIKSLGHNMFLVGQFYDSDLEVAFRRNTCFVRKLEGVDLLKGNRTINLYTINLHEMASTSSICLMARATSTKTKKIMVTMNVTFDELLAMDFEQSSSKPRLQGMTSGQISSGLDLTYALLKITTQKPTEHKLDLLFKAMYDDYIGDQPSATPRTILATQAPQVLHTPTTSTSIADTTLTPTNSSSQATNIPNTSQGVDEFKTQ
nr:copia protein [Tanacetum cinerariifolium]